MKIDSKVMRVINIFILLIEIYFCRLGFGITNKIILFYEKRFWKEGIDELFFIWKNQNEENRPWWKSIVTTHILPDVANNRYYLVVNKYYCTKGQRVYCAP